MAKERRKQTKAERRQANGAAQAKAGGRTKAERRQAREARGQSSRGAVPAKTPGRSGDVADDESPEGRIEARLARIEEAVAIQSERSEELLAKLDQLAERRPA